MPIEQRDDRKPGESVDVDKDRNQTLDDPGAAVPGYGRSAGQDADQPVAGEKDHSEPIPLGNNETIGNP